MNSHLQSAALKTAPWCLTPKRTLESSLSSYFGVGAAQFNRQVSLVARFKSRIVFVLLPLLASAGNAELQIQPTTFQELFGIDESNASAVFGTDGERCLIDALDDFNRVLAGQQPIHAKTDDFSSLTDGGTALWRHTCYELTIHKSLTSFQLKDGTWVHGHVVGPSLKLKLGPAESQRSPISRTRFAFLKRVTPTTSLNRMPER